MFFFTNVKYVFTVFSVFLSQLKKEGNLLIHAMGDEENVDSNVEVKGTPLVKTGTAKEVGDLNGILGGN